MRTPMTTMWTLQRVLKRWPRVSTVKRFSETYLDPGLAPRSSRCCYMCQRIIFFKLETHSESLGIFIDPVITGGERVIAQLPTTPRLYKSCLIASLCHKEIRNNKSLYRKNCGAMSFIPYYSYFEMTSWIRSEVALMVSSLHRVMVSWSWSMWPRSSWPCVRR